MKITSTRRLFLQGTAITGVAATVAGCGAQQSAEEQQKEQQEKNDDAVKEQQSLPSTAWEKVDYEQVKDGGTLTLAIAQLPANWNQNHIDGNEASLGSVIDPIRGIGTYAMVQEDGTIVTNPDFLESAEVTSEDPQIITAKFNQKAKWDNGNPVVVDDLIAQFKAQNGTNEDFATVSTQGWESIKEVRKKDDYTAEIEYKTPFPDWISFTYPTGPKELFANPDAFNKSHASEPVPGLGPFKIKSVDDAGGVITFERNPDWWGKKAKLDTIILKVTTQQNAPSSFANSEIDALDIGDGDTYGQAKGRKDATIQKSNGLTWTHLTINVKSPDSPLGDVKVREAIFHAVNRDAVSRAVVEPLESPVILKNNYIYMPGQDGYEDSFDGAIDTQDAAKAEQILKDAGYTKDGDVYAKDGKKLEFSVVIPAETKSNEDRARQVMNDLNKIGFKVKLQTVPSDKYFDDYVLVKNFDFVTFSWVGTVLAELSGSNTYLPESNQNYTGIKVPELDEINKRLQTEMDPAKRKEIANEFSKKVAENFMVLPFYATPIITGVKDGIVNYGSSQFESVDWTKVGYKA